MYYYIERDGRFSVMVFNKNGRTTLTKKTEKTLSNLIRELRERAMNNTYSTK